MRTAFLSLVLILLIIFSVNTSYGLDCESENNGLYVTDIYSDLETCDITLQSSENISGLKLDVTLEHAGSILDRQTFSIEAISPGKSVTKAFMWDTDNKGDGKYTVRTAVTRDGCTLIEDTYNFIAGRQIIPRLTVNDLVANSRGASIMVTPTDAVLFDVEYMLIEGSDVIYSSTQKKVSVHTQPMEVSRDWNVILENNRQYSAKVKVKIYSPSVSYIALKEDFVAHDDVFISDSYKDHIGASATIEGISQVPFTGSVRFTVSKQDNGKEIVVYSVTEKSPVILNGDDETVETIWQERLTSGLYRLVIEIIANDGDILDREESIIESDYELPAEHAGTTGSDDAGQTPGFMLPGSLAIVAVAALIKTCRKEH
jgi:hypothetical protein